jgi:magnesium and cobalt exporter, CNNM family
VILTLPLFVCLVVVAWLTAAATGVRSVSRIWLRHWVEQQLRGAPSAELYLERPQRLLLAAATGVAVTVYIAGTLIGGLYAGRTLLLLRALLTYAVLVLLFGQLVPRAIGRRWPTRLLPILLPLLRLVEIVLAPLLAIVAAVMRPLARRHAPPKETEPHDELEDLLREGALEGVGETAEIAIISGVVQFGQKTVDEVMTPRADVFALDEALPPAELARRVAQSGYSRIPIYRETIDQIIGMVHAFDLLKRSEDEPLALRPVGGAKTSARCNEFLFTMLRERKHLAVICDDASRLVGIVTLEDLLEELVGDIRDEHDEPLSPSA